MALTPRQDAAELLAQVTRIVNAADPIGLLAMDCPPDEYGPEIPIIAARVLDASSETDLRRSVHKIFVDWFDLSTAGPEATYEDLARTLWQLRSRDGSSNYRLERP